MINIERDVEDELFSSKSVLISKAYDLAISSLNASFTRN